MENCSFDPFQDRLSRDIRNDLSSSLGMVMQEKKMKAPLAVAERYLKQDLAPCYREYIRSRLSRYEAFLKELRQGPGDIISQALILWDLRLFFEVHEVLEQAWMKAVGEEKKVLQAMIRAAGVYIKIESGYPDSAEKIARRALPVLEGHKKIIAPYFNPERLLRCLRDLALPPPLLLNQHR